MTNREYLEKLSNELFDLKNKPVEELIKDKMYCEFEDDVEQKIREDFAKIGCDTSNGEPTWFGLSLWMDSQVSEKFKNKLEQKYMPH